MRKVIAKRLVESKTTVPHYYLAMDICVDDLMALREKVTLAPTPTPQALNSKPYAPNLAANTRRPIHVGRFHPQRRRAPRQRGAVVSRRRCTRRAHRASRAPTAPYAPNLAANTRRPIHVGRFHPQWRRAPRQRGAVISRRRCTRRTHRASRAPTPPPPPSTLHTRLGMDRGRGAGSRFCRGRPRKIPIAFRETPSVEGAVFFWKGRGCKLQALLLASWRP